MFLTILKKETALGTQKTILNTLIWTFRPETSLKAQKDFRPRQELCHFRPEKEFFTVRKEL